MENKGTASQSWRDIGDKKAVEKTSQALREGAPENRKKVTELMMDGITQDFVRETCLKSLAVGIETRTRAVTGGGGEDYPPA